VNAEETATVHCAVMDITASLPTLVVVGNGMVGQQLLASLAATGALDRYRVVTFAEEPRPAYDRVHLSAYLDGRTAEDLSLADPAITDHPHVEVRLGERVAGIDRGTGMVSTERGATVAYDHLVLATGSYPFVPPIDGRDGPGCFVYRTLEDLDALRAAAADARSGAVIGGGLLGLEAANALRSLGLDTHVVEFAPRLMPVQVDDGGGAALRSRIGELGIGVHTDKATTCIRRDEAGRVQGLSFAQGPDLDIDLVVFSAGIRPRDELARSAGLEVGERGGVVIDDGCLTSDPRISAIGECALHGGRIYGLVAPGYAMARVVADRLAGGRAQFTGAGMSTKLKLLGVDVASFGDAQGATPGCRSITWSDPVTDVYKKLVVSGDGTRLLGGVLVGDAEAYDDLHARHANGIALPDDPGSLLLPSGDGAPALGAAAIPEAATVCSCNNVSKAELCSAVAGGCTTIGALKAETKAGSTCGSCTSLCKSILDDELTKAGIEVDTSICEHFAYTRQELFDIVRLRRLRTFAELLEGWGTGAGCEICKPAVASVLASLWDEHVLSDELAGLQDTNDRFLANFQKDGTYSVVPRVPGGEITPDKLIVLGEVAREFDLYTKITGGQRIDLLGARLEQLPTIWERLVEAGFESGHAYGKALRTVKSCVGQTWCRYGVQDSTSMAIFLEERYRGLRSPHKLKGGVSGCARECAEAQSKDFGVIATEAGWNLYVAGNGGMRPAHGTLLAEDLDAETVVRYLDRFMAFYIRTADRLERTSVWFAKLEGGIDHLRRVIIDDSLGIAAELEADIARHVAGYECEWKATLGDPERLQHFRHFVNDEVADPSLAYVRERGQRRPATPEEVALLPVLVRPTAEVS
jgi:nitrite reductase (NADH) large subunit